jgi:hypothetical protein
MAADPPAFMDAEGAITRTVTAESGLFAKPQESEQRNMVITARIAFMTGHYSGSSAKRVGASNGCPKISFSLLTGEEGGEPGSIGQDTEVRLRKQKPNNHRNYDPRLSKPDAAWVIFLQCMPVFCQI